MSLKYFRRTSSDCKDLGIRIILNFFIRLNTLTNQKFTTLQQLFNYDFTAIFPLKQIFNQTSQLFFFLIAFQLDVTTIFLLKSFSIRLHNYLSSQQLFNQTSQLFFSQQLFNQTSQLFFFSKAFQLDFTTIFLLNSFSIRRHNYFSSQKLFNQTSQLFIFSIVFQLDFIRLHNYSSSQQLFNQTSLGFTTILLLKSSSYDKWDSD